MNSFRPINNLNILEKITEEHLKNQLTEYLDKYEIINDNHHGGKINHSTTTAVAQINNILYKNWETNLITTTITTDLSSAFDTIDHNILLLKLKHYGITNNSNKLIESYLSQRKQFVKIESFKSIIRDSPNCSCIQGGKLSGLLYTIYVNELPLIKNLMHNDFFQKITNKPKPKYKGIKHDTINFVDDCTNIIACKDPKIINTYITNFYNLLENFYHINKLKINDDKSKILITCKRGLKKASKKIIFMANKFRILPSKFIIILGFRIEEDLGQSKQINNTIAKVSNRIFTLQKLKKYTNLKTRLKIANAIVIGSINYGLPLFLNATKDQLSKLNSLLIRAARTVIGYHSLKLSQVKMDKITGWTSIYHMITSSSIILHNNTINSKNPHILKSFYKITKHKRYQINTSKKIPIYIPKGKMTENGFIQKSCELFNFLPEAIKNEEGTKFKQELKMYINKIFPYRSIHKDLDLYVT